MRSYVSPRTKAISKKNLFAEEYLQPDSPMMHHSDSSYLRNKGGVPGGGMMAPAMSNPYDYLTQGSMNGYESDNGYYSHGASGYMPQQQHQQQQNMLSEQVIDIH